MADFVYDNLALPAAKTADIKTIPAGLATSYWGQIDANAVFDALGSLRGAAGFTNAKSAKFGAKGDGVTDDTAALQAAINFVFAAGGGTVFLPVGTYIIGQLTLPTGIHIIGNGQRETILKAKTSLNAPMLVHAANTSTGVYIENLQLHGNDLNNSVGGCLAWAPNASGDGPGIMLRNVHITHCAPGTAAAESVLFNQVAGWPVLDNVRIFTNTGRGLVVKSSDGYFHNVYAAGNGLGGFQGVAIIGGAANRFAGCYFGGSDGGESVLIWGAQYNEFIDCVNDSAWQHGYRFLANAGVESNYNSIIGGFINAPSQQTTNTYDHISFESASTQNRVIGVGFDNLKTNKGRYAIKENGTATNNFIMASRFGTFGTGVNGLAAGASRIIQSPGYNPLGIASVTVTASPFTYTNNDNVPENLYVSGGTVSSIVKNGFTIYTSSPNDVWLEPGESIIITYTVAPTIFKDRK